MPIRDVAPDTVVDERYQIINRIGSGGMADVYCAQDLQLGRKVAVKLLYRRFAEDAEFVERFRREAQAAAGLQHPNVVGVYDRGEWDGTYYIAMEYLEGHSLKEVVDAHAPLEPSAAIGIVLQVLRAARFAHQRGIIHRDIKPHNAIVDDEYRVKVTDFGIARAGASDMTETGSIMGTAQYLSPEQAQGHSVGPQTDLYSIGIVLYELLAARVPFEGDSAVTIALKQVSEPPVPPSVYNQQVPPELDAVVMRALEKQPEARFADADEFIAALEGVLGVLHGMPIGENTAIFGAGAAGAIAAGAAAGAATGETRIATAGAAGPPTGPNTGAFPDQPLEPPEDPEKRKRWPWIVGGIVALLVLAAGAYGLVKLFDSPDQVRVPNVVGTDFAVASTVLKNRGFKVDEQRVKSNAPKDRVLRQDPQPLTQVDKGSEIQLTVSDGPGTQTVPEVQNQTEKEARRRLEAAGFKVRVDQEASDRVDEGAATRTAPPAGSQIDRGSRVTLFVSSGKEAVTVPDVTGDSQANAESELSSANLRVTVEEQDSTQDPGTVISQNPSGGTEVDADSTVTIVVARQNDDVQVPSVEGRSEDEARNAISAAGLVPITQEQTTDNEDENGIVIDQRPGGSSEVSQGSRVTIFVGRFQQSDVPALPGE